MHQCRHLVAISYFVYLSARWHYFHCKGATGLYIDQWRKRHATSWNGKIRYFCFTALPEKHIIIWYHTQTEFKTFLIPKTEKSTFLRLFKALKMET